MTANNKQTTASKVASVISIPGYEIKDLLGRGGMAMVYLAVQTSIHREVALKVLSPDHTDETFSERFLREARIASQLAHPNIITIFDAGIHNDIHYMSMEYIKGKSFNEARDLLNRKQKIEIIKQIAQALDFASKKGFVHRDIKPENILLHQGGRAILTDFGIARTNDVSKGLTETGKILGTPYFMSPEQTKGLKIDHRTDIYSLGVVLFQALAGYVPYDGPSLVSICIKHLSDPIPQLPKGLEIFQPIINTCMSKKPEHRYQHASELFNALNAITDQKLNQIDNTANAFKESARNYEGKTQAETDAMVAKSGMPLKQKNVQLNSNQPNVSQPKIQAARKRPAENFNLTHNYVKPERQTFITNSKDFKSLERRNRRILFLLIILGLAVGYYQKDELLKLWKLNGLPLAEKYVPENFTQYIPLRSKKTETVIVKKPVTPAKSAADLENEKIQQLLTSLDKIPSNAITLAQIFSKQLEINPGNPDTLNQVENLKQWFKLRILQLINSKDFNSATNTLNSVTVLYPDINQTEEFQTLNNKLYLDKKNEPFLQKSRVYFAVNALNQPAGANALEQLQLVLKNDSKNQEALEGLNKIATHFRNKAKLEISSKNFFNALNSTQSGLQAIHDDTELLNMQAEIRTAINNTKNLNDLIKHAQQLYTSGKIIEPDGNNAYEVYKKILTKDSNNKLAKSGLKKIHNNTIKKLTMAINQNQLQVANKTLSAIERLFPQSQQLKPLKLKLQTEMNAVLPIVPNIKISSKPFTNINTTNLQKIKIGQLLYIGFNYDNFTQDKTALVANIYNGKKQKLVLQQSLTISGKKGKHYFTIQLPKTGITSGDYSIELLLGKSRLIKANLFGIH